MRAEARFPAMGSDAHVIVVDGTVGSIDLARDLVDELEARWSRFRDDSEVTVMNREAGRPVAVSGATLALVERAIEGARVTDGRYDPTVLRAVERAGYDRSFELLDRAAAPGLQPDDDNPVVVAGYDRVMVDRSACTVTVPRGVGFDPGGIGKGFAADLVVEALLRDGAAGACVNLGGDLRVEGESPDGGPWVAGVEHPTRSRLAALLRLDRGAVATSTRTRRTWGPSNEQHHLIDPATGRPASTPVVSATAVAAEGWQAEVLSKAAFLAGPVAGLRLLENHGAQGLVVDEDGHVYESGGLGAFTGAQLQGSRA